MKIAICNQKGGAGKTTITLLLAYALGEAGKSVTVVDRDPQKTATKWLTNAPGKNVAVADSPNGSAVTFFDTPGSLESQALVESIREADRAILVSSTSPADLWSTQEAAGVIREVRPDLKVAVLFNKVDCRTEFGKQTDGYAEAIGFPSLQNTLPNRQAFQRAALAGWAALKGSDRELMNQLAIEIITL